MVDPQSSSTTGYHLFLEPTGELRDVLRTTIERLAEAYGGPVFPPHVTLVPAIEGLNDEQVLEKARTLASELTPFSIQFGSLSGEPTFFRTYYVCVQNSPELTHAHELAQKVYGMSSEESYRPHLSLFYGNLDEERRTKLVSETVAPHEATFTADRIHVYRTEGPTEAWIKIGEVLMGA